MSIHSKLDGVLSVLAWCGFVYFYHPRLFTRKSLRSVYVYSSVPIVKVHFMNLVSFSLFYSSISVDRHTMFLAKDGNRVAAEMSAPQMPNFLLIGFWLTMH